MSIFIGQTPILGVYIGNQAVNAIYIGTSKIWPVPALDITIDATKELLNSNHPLYMQYKIDASDTFGSNNQTVLDTDHVYKITEPKYYSIRFAHENISNAENHSWYLNGTLQQSFQNVSDWQTQEFIIPQTGNFVIKLQKNQN